MCESNNDSDRKKKQCYRMDHGTILDLIHFGILFVLFLSFDVALDVVVIWSIKIFPEKKQELTNR